LSSEARYGLDRQETAELLTGQKSFIKHSGELSKLSHVARLSLPGKQRAKFFSNRSRLRGYPCGRVRQRKSDRSYRKLLVFTICFSRKQSHGSPDLLHDTLRGVNDYILQLIRLTNEFGSVQVENRDTTFKSVAFYRRLANFTFTFGDIYAH
jgi:hypothetical protein